MMPHAAFSARYSGGKKRMLQIDRFDVGMATPVFAHADSRRSSITMGYA